MPVPVPVVEFTVRARVVVRVSVPLVPVTVTVPDPVAPAEAVKVTRLLVPVAEAGLKLAVTPEGRPLALRATAPVNPPVLAMAIVLVTEAPGLTVNADGAAESVKFWPGLTVRPTAVERDRVPLVPEMVTVAEVVLAVAEALKVTTLLVPVV